MWSLKEVPESAGSRLTKIVPEFKNGMLGDKAQPQQAYHCVLHHRNGQILVGAHWCERERVLALLGSVEGLKRSSWIG